MLNILSSNHLIVNVFCVFYLFRAIQIIQSFQNILILNFLTIYTLFSTFFFLHFFPLKFLLYLTFHFKKETITLHCAIVSCFRFKSHDILLRFFSPLFPQFFSKPLLSQFFLLIPDLIIAVRIFIFYQMLQFV